MEIKEKNCRFTIDVPIDTHKRLKALAAIHGKSMRKIVIEAIIEQLEHLNTKKDFFKSEV